MSNKSPSLDDEIARWHRFSDGAIGSKFALMTLFLATTPPELREQLRGTIISETGDMINLRSEVFHEERIH